MERKTLREAREARGWSQEEFAEHFETIQRAAISNWETGKDNPLLRNKREAAAILEWQGSLEELFALTEDKTREETSPTGEYIELLIPDFIRMNLSNSLLCIAHTSYRAPSEMTEALRSAIEESNAMNIDDITRREALRTLAALPMTTLGQNPRITTSHYTQMLTHCTAALEACWQLYRGSDPIGTQHAFECCCTYVPLLETIAHDSCHHRKQALDLAAHYAILQIQLGWSCVGNKEAVIYAQKARDLSRETGNILLQLSALPKVAWTYIQSKNYAEAWKTMQEGAYVLKCYQSSKKNAPLPSGVIGNFNSSYAMVQADNGIDPDTSLGIATDSEPLDGHVAFIEFTTVDQWYEAARTCNSKGDPMQAMMWLGKLMDLETFAFRPDVPQHEGDRVSWISALTRSLLQLEKRDMDYIIKTWTSDIEGAKALKAEHKFERATTNLEIMKALYPREQAIRQLIPLTSHW